MRTPDALHVLADGESMGILEQGASAEALRFRYDPAWQTRPDAFPLSLSLPLVDTVHAGAIPARFFGALLPDNPSIREAFAQRHQVAASDTFGLLAALGEDCPGAIQCVRPERLDAVVRGEMDRVEWLGPAAVRARLAGLRTKGIEEERAGDAGQFSLAGAQAKTALLYDPNAERWGVPSGRVPTTHILKPAPRDDPLRADNEHLCLSLAAHVGLPAARATVRRDPEGNTLVVARFDRARLNDGTIARLHQEDCCQALGIAPEQKYEHRGGPSPRQIITLLRDRSTNAQGDIDTFLAALALNWVTYGTDAHGRNYSILLGASGRMQLAPLYDLISALPYRHIKEHTINLSMLIGPTRHAASIDAVAWRALAEQCALAWARVYDTVGTTVQAIHDAAPTVCTAAREEGAPADFATDFEKRLTRRARRCLYVLGKRRA
jgi:serine/threonine-protein kinase HipA